MLADRNADAVELVSFHLTWRSHSKNTKKLEPFSSEGSCTHGPTVCVQGDFVLLEKGSNFLRTLGSHKLGNCHPRHINLMP